MHDQTVSVPDTTGDGRAHALAGVVGAGVALGVAELAGGLLPGMPSLVDAVAGWTVQFLPGGLITWGIETFGEADRPIIAAIITVAILLMGAVAGVQAGRAASGGRLIWVGVTAIGIAIAAGDINAVVPVVVSVTGAAALGGWMVLRWLGQTLPSADGEQVSAARGLNRRGVLTAGVMGLAAAALGWRGRTLSNAPGTRGAGNGVARPDSVTLPAPTMPAAPVPEGARLQLDGLTPLHVPNDEFYRIDTAFSSVPQLDHTTWSMRMHGHVRNELTLTHQDLLDRELVEVDITIACVSNEVGDDLIGNARWLGVRLDELLDEAGVMDTGTQVVGRAVDGWTAGFPTEVAMDGRSAIVAVGMNGAPLPVEHGFPARLVVPGLYGYVSATKWLSDIELVPWDDFDGYWVPRGWSKRGPVKTQSRIDTVVPDDTGDRMVAGGVAWAPTRGVERVEVRVDDGEFVAAALAEALSDITWVQWRAPLDDVAPGRHTLTVRATDGDGVTQPQQPTPAHPDGAQGWHTVTFKV